MKCTICEETPRCVVTYPCTHCVMCEPCAATQNECPFCHQVITQRNTIFIPVWCAHLVCSSSTQSPFGFEYCLTKVTVKTRWHRCVISVLSYNYCLDRHVGASAYLAAGWWRGNSRLYVFVIVAFLLLILLLSSSYFCYYYYYNY